MPASAPARSVFLSYAREDTEPARRIADALRGFGIEVWFDQSELRGGDAWDAKIKRQIRECSLFVALISAHSQARGEGYFRREWKIAIERTHDMAGSIPFLLPLAIDGTAEAGALVPEEFMRVQWTRLPDGVPTAQFVERVSGLLNGSPAPRIDSPPAHSAAVVPAAGRPKAGVPGWVWGVAGGIVVAAAAVFVSRETASVAPPAAVPNPRPAAVAPAAIVDDKSVAVLPFANMSDDKENAFFTEGIQEDILTNLALVHELRVVSRTSVMQYRDTTKPIRQIAAELGVAYILEGSVRRAGSKVRVTGQLIKAATDEHIWAKAYDRDLTDIFGIQSELSQAIAVELKAAISPAEKAMLDRRPTENAEAYDLYLKARRLSRAYDMEKIISLLQQATTLDPAFARAWGDLADAIAYRAFQFKGSMEDNRAQAKAAIDQAIKIAPEDPEVMQSLGTYYYYAFRDFSRAAEIYQKLLALRPNDAGAHNSIALILRRQGRWPEALAQFHRATELDPADPVYLNNLVSCLHQARRYDELAAGWRKLATFDPTDLNAPYQAALASYYATGSRREVDDFLAHLSPAVAESPDGLSVRIDWADVTGNRAEFIRLLKLQPQNPTAVLTPWEQDIMAARFLKAEGDKPGAQQRLDSAVPILRAQLAREPQNPRLLLMRAEVETVQDQRAEALADIDRAQSLLPESADAIDGPVYAAVSFFVLDTLGEKERALAAVQHLLQQPGSGELLNVYAMKADPHLRLRTDPRFQALLDDPKNNAPMF